MYSNTSEIVYEVKASTRSSRSCQCHPPSSTSGTAKEWKSKRSRRHWLQFDSRAADHRAPQGCRFFICATDHPGVRAEVQLRCKIGKGWEPLSEPETHTLGSHPTCLHLLSRGRRRAPVAKMRVCVTTEQECAISVLHLEWLRPPGPPQRSYPAMPLAGESHASDTTELVGPGAPLRVRYGSWAVGDLGRCCPLSRGVVLTLCPHHLQVARIEVQCSQGHQEWAPLVDTRCRPWGYMETRLIKFPSVHFTPRYYRIRIHGRHRKGAAAARCRARLHRWALLPPHTRYSAISACSINMDVAQTTTPPRLGCADNDDPYRWDGAEFEEIGVVVDCGVCCSEVVAVRLGVGHDEDRGAELGLLFEWSENGCIWSKHELPALAWSGRAAAERTFFVPPSRARYYRVALRTDRTAVVQIKYVQLLREGDRPAAAPKPTLTVDAKSLMELTHQHKDAHSTPLAVMLLCLYSLCTNKDEYVQSVQSLLSKGVVYSDNHSTCSMVDGYTKRTEKRGRETSVQERLDQYDRYMMQDLPVTAGLHLRGGAA